MTRRRRSAVVASAVLPLVVGLGVTGCGADTAPGDEVPALAQRLARVDAAVEAGRFERVRAELQRLADETRRAQAAGDLTDEEAGRILDAAGAVLARLPGTIRPTTSPSPSPTPTRPTPTPSESSPGKSGDKPDKHGHEGRGKGEDD